MLTHTYTEPAIINFSKLEERLLQTNQDRELTVYRFWRLLIKMLISKEPTLIMATGGSKAAAYYLQMILENNGIICEVIEPRDYFYKKNINAYERLIVLSNIGKTNGVMEALKTFAGKSILITGEYTRRTDDYTYREWGYQEPIFETVDWSSEAYLKNSEKSFISIIPTLAPMLMFLELSMLLDENKDEFTTQDYMNFNDKIRELIAKSQERIDKISFDFKDTNLIQILSGYDTKTSSCILESNMIESGASGVITHDKGSFCHGRNNILFHNPESPIVYFTHRMKKMDKEIFEVLIKEYPNIFLLHTLDENQSIYWQEFYLSLQMYYLSKKIADDKKIDLTMPEYNPTVVRKLYRYKGEM